MDDLAASLLPEPGRDLREPGYRRVSGSGTGDGLYEAGSGRSLDDLRWYEVLAATRHAIITVRTMSRTIAFGSRDAPADPDDLINFRILLEAMLDGTYWQDVDHDA